MPGHIDELIVYLSSDQPHGGADLPSLLTNVLQELRELVGSDQFTSEGNRAISALREYNQDDYANAVEMYSQEPTDENFIKATTEIMKNGAIAVQAPQLSDVADVPSDADLSEGLSGVVERVQSITPEFISQKFDEALADPKVLEELAERNISVDDVMGQKDVLISQLGEKLQSLVENLPNLQEEGMEIAREQIAQAVEDFPSMFDEAFNSELSNAMERASQRMQDKFEQAARETDAARQFLENGEMPADSNTEVAQKYDAAVINMADNLMQMRANDVKAFEGMAEHLSSQGDFGQQVMQVVNQRIAEEGAVAEPIGMQNR